mgnify:CR=1 FL=1
MEVNLVYLSLGSNCGDTKANILDAITHIKQSNCIKLLEISSYYQTPAWGYISNNPYLNCCISIETSLSPIELLDLTQDIERILGRKIKNEYSDRTIDIDIITYNTIKYKDQRLQIPHKYWKERSFVLFPLRDLTEYIQIEQTSHLLTDLITNLGEVEIKVINV